MYKKVSTRSFKVSQNRSAWPNRLIKGSCLPAFFCTRLHRPLFPVLLHVTRIALSTIFYFDLIFNIFFINLFQTYPERQMTYHSQQPFTRSDDQHEWNENSTICYICMNYSFYQEYLRCSITFSLKNKYTIGAVLFWHPAYEIRIQITAIHWHTQQLWVKSGHISYKWMY